MDSLLLERVKRSGGMMKIDAVHTHMSREHQWNLMQLFSNRCQD